MKTKILDGEMAEAGRSYDADLYGWVEDQVALLRAGEVGSIDAFHITRELDELGRGEFNKLVSVLRVVLQHFLKWDYQPERRSRSWALTIDAQRVQIESELQGSPSLKPRLEEALHKAYTQGRRDAARETNLSMATFPETCPYNWDDITSRPIAWGDDSSHERH